MIFFHEHGLETFQFLLHNLDFFLSFVQFVESLDISSDHAKRGVPLLDNQRLEGVQKY